MNRPNSRRSVAVLGGGVGGAAAAIALADAGVEVCLFEKRTFPRQKACGCCLGAAGVAAADRLGVGPAVRAAAIPTTRLIGLFDSGPGCPVDIPMAPGLAIDRGTLDGLLIAAAVDRGALVLQPAEGLVVGQDARGVDVMVRSGLGMTSRRFDHVVVATGLTGRHAVGPATPFKQRPHGPVGWTAHLPAGDDLTGDLPLAPGTIVMMVGDRGYVGLVKLPGGAVDVAAAVRLTGRGRPHQAVADVIDSTLGWPREILDRLSGWVAQTPSTWVTPPLRRRREARGGRVLMIGDAAGYVEPMTGEGMTWAIEGGVAAASSIFQNRTATWSREAASRLRRRKRLCASVTTAFRYPAIRWAGSHLIHQLPGVVGPINATIAAG